MSSNHFEDLRGNLVAKTVDVFRLCGDSFEETRGSFVVKECPEKRSLNCNRSSGFDAKQVGRAQLGRG